MIYYILLLAKYPLKPGKLPRTHPRDTHFLIYLHGIAYTPARHRGCCREENDGASRNMGIYTLPLYVDGHEEFSPACLPEHPLDTGRLFLDS